MGETDLQLTRPKWRVLVRLTRVVVLVYLGILVVLMFLERSMIYPAPNASLGIWSPTSFSFEDVSFASADGTRLHGWYFETAQPRAYVLFCHGNGEDVSLLGPWAAELSEKLGVSIFAFDYRGYGKSQGVPHEAGLLADGQAALAWLAQRAGIPANQVVAYGRSLGGGVAVALAEREGVRALVLERTFHSLVEIGAQRFWWAPVRMIMRNRYPSAQRIATYHGPLLQMHGLDDTLVPVESAKLLHQACPSNSKQLLLIPGMGHNDPSPPEFYREFDELLQRLPEPDAI